MNRLLGATAAVTMALLVGCSASDTSSSSSDSAAVGGATADEAGGPGGAPVADADRQVVTTATASLSVDNPAESAQR